MITIAYMTNRKDPLIKWFFDSLHRELAGQVAGIQLVVVDYWCQALDKSQAERKRVEARRAKFKEKSLIPFKHTPPKPSVWQGPHRLTKSNFFAPSNARNTALCFAEGEYIVFVDDLSVLLPGWFQEVEAAAKLGVVACGSYGKALEMEVVFGELRRVRGMEDSLTMLTPETAIEHLQKDYPHGIDSRLKQVEGWEPVPAAGSWMFGCSCAIPVPPLLEIEGYDEDCDPMGGEDYCCGMMLERLGLKFQYRKRMMTIESEEGHHQDVPFNRPIKDANSPEDASVRMLNWVQSGVRRKGANYWGRGGLRVLREKVLNGSSLPILGIPEHDWRDSQPLREM
jgi:hypothetical protein